MSINGNENGLVINGGKLRVAGGIVVNGSIAYSENATGFGGVTAQIDNDNTLNITAGKVSGVAEIDRGTGADITSVNHTNVVNNTTIHIALKNTAGPGIFIYLNRFEGVRTNYTDDYVIAPGETGMLTLRKVNGVLSLFVREMYSTNYTVTSTNPFFIKDGLNYKYPLYTGVTTDVVLETINGTSYYRPTSGLRTKSRPPKGLPELIASPTGNLAIGNNGTGTTVNYDVWGVPSSFKTGSIYNGNTIKAAILVENGESSGSFTESGASSGDAYALYVNDTDVSSSDTVSFSGFAGTIAFHHDTFANSGDPYGDGTLAGATANAHIFSDTLKDIVYTWGTLSSNTATTTETTYIWTPPTDIEGADVLMVAGGGGGGTSNGGGGGAGELVYLPNQNISSTQKTIVIGNGGAGANNGSDTSFNSISLNGGGAGASLNVSDGGSGGSGGGASVNRNKGQGLSVKTGNGYGNRGGYSIFDGYQGGGGGGGAGEFGAAGGNSSKVYGAAGGFAGNGGDGLNEVIINGEVYNFASIFGTSYGENISREIWFAGGGGGQGGDGIENYGVGGRGGGGNSSRGTEIDAIKHTGSGGGADNGNGGSGIVLIKSSGVGKTIPKVTGASFDSTNVTFTVQGASNITNIKYTINGGSEATTPVGTLAVAHGLASAASITVVAWAVNANGNQISTKKTVSGTIP